MSRTKGFVASPKTAITNPARNRAVNLWRMYRMTIEEYEALVAEQRGLCAVCQRGEEVFKNRRRPGRPRADGKIADVSWLQVDHCHATHQVRGLLCPDCNSAAARLGDSADRARSLASYLDRAGLINETSQRAS